MPLYEYQCTKCKHTFEKIKKFSDPPEKKCPKCGARVEQLLSAPAIQFKGAGWYVTDYAKKGGASDKGGSEGSSSESNSGERKSETKSETKSESKSETKTESKQSKTEKK